MSTIMLASTETESAQEYQPHREISIVVSGTIASANTVALQAKAGSTFQTVATFTDDERTGRFPGGRIYKMTASTAGPVAEAEYTDISGSVLL